MRASSVSGSMPAARGSSAGQSRSAAALPPGPARPRHEERRSLRTQSAGSRPGRAPLRRQRAPCCRALPLHHERTAQGQGKARDAEGRGRKRKALPEKDTEGERARGGAERRKAVAAWKPGGPAPPGRSGVYWQVKPLPVRRAGTSGGRPTVCPLKGHGPAARGACAVRARRARQSGRGRVLASNKYKYQWQRVQFPCTVL